MQNTSKYHALAMLCTPDGFITKCIRNDYGLAEPDLVGANFSSLFNKWHIAKAIDLLLQTKIAGIAADFELGLLVQGEETALRFSGLLLDDQLLIIGTTKTSDSLGFLEQLQQINNEQANQIRQLLKNKYTLAGPGRQNDTRLFEELSRLNNELVNLQRELSKKNAELARLNEEKNRFVGMAAHDIRNPLGVIMAYAEFLLMEASNFTERQKVILNNMYTSAGFLLKLIEDLLDISKIESGKLNLTTSRADLIKLAEKSIDLNNTLAEKKQISIKLIYHLRPVMAVFDTHKIEQVFNNLITNAVKYSHAGSIVTVTITTGNEKVTVSIRDQGVGIKEEDLANIFTPFGKATSAGTQGEKSTGLGLSIVKKIIEGHGSTIRVESTPGKGSVFFFDLPLYKP